MRALDAALKKAVLERPEGVPDMFGMTHEDWRKLVARALESPEGEAEAVDRILELLVPEEST